MNWYSQKPAGWSESVWRAVRTLAQVGIPALSLWLSTVAVTRVWDWQGLAYAVALPALSAALSAWSNR